MNVDHQNALFIEKSDMKISNDQLNTIIANQIKQQGLNGVFDDSVLESIKEKLKAEYRKMRSTPAEQLIPEGDVNSFPYEVEKEVTPANTGVEIEVQPTMIAGSEPTEQPSQPRVYSPELPAILKDVEPAKLVVMEPNDIIENGENLSYKQFMTMDDIHMNKSMQDLWKGEGVTKAIIYQMKFETIGEMQFDYANGTASFTPITSTPETVTAQQFKDNPYKAETELAHDVKPPSEEEISAYVRTAVDIEDIVKKVAMEMMAKAYEEKTAMEAKEHMKLSPPEPPIPTDWEANNVPKTVGQVGTA